MNNKAKVSSSCIADTSSQGMQEHRRLEFPRRQTHALPGSIEAVIRAHCVMPEEFLAAVSTGFCRGKRDTIQQSHSLYTEWAKGWINLTCPWQGDTHSA